MPVSLHSMEVVNQLATLVDLPAEFVRLFIKNCLTSPASISDPNKHARHARLVSVFLMAFLRNRNAELAAMWSEIEAFCVQHSRVAEAARLFQTLKQHLQLDGTPPPPTSPAAGPASPPAAPPPAPSSAPASAGSGAAGITTAQALESIGTEPTPPPPQTTTTATAAAAPTTSHATTVPGSEAVGTTGNGGSAQAG